VELTTAEVAVDRYKEIPDRHCGKMMRTSDPAAEAYQKERIRHWDRVSEYKKRSKRIGVFYHALLRKYYRFLVPEGQRILEIGCGHGHLLAALNPSMGVGIDFSMEMISAARQYYPDLNFVVSDAYNITISQKFDVIILSDLVNDLWDLQTVLDNLRRYCHPSTRIIINYYNNLWRVPLSVVNKLGLGAEMLEQNWFSPHDVTNLLQLTGFETVKRQAQILMPLKVPVVGEFLNRYLSQIVPFKWFTLTNFSIARLVKKENPSRPEKPPRVSVIIPTRNEAGNIEKIFERIPEMGSETELIFVEGHSKDETYEILQQAISDRPGNPYKLFRQSGDGKGDAVRLGFEKASGDILMILDADMTVPPEDLPRFYDAIESTRGEFINGVRLVYPLENQSMRLFNIIGNKFFGLAFSWLLGQPIKDTLCGTKVLWRSHYQRIAANRHYFGEFDPFGDFDLLFGASKLNLKIVEMPIRYRARQYGDTNIDRWRHGVLLLKMVAFAAKRLKFI
jgi:ubiquinone/menaquinone biosynthesis C-methylase UbiE